MGNHLSCVSPLPSNAHKRLHDSSTPVADLPKRLVFWDCETATLSILQGSLTAAEVMLEFPGQFVSPVPNMDSISAGASGPRIAALPADKELEPSQLYLLLHMSRLNSRFSLREMHSFKSLKLSQKASGGQTFNGSKVVPVTDDKYPESTGEALAEPAPYLKNPPFNKSGDRNTAESADYVPRYVAQYSCLWKAKSWMPALETVEEEGLQR